MSKKLHKRASALPTLLWLMLLALLPAQLSARDFKYAYEGKILTYTVIYEGNGGTVKTNEGKWRPGRNDPGNNVSGDLIIPSKVYDGDDEYTVVELGAYAFSDCRDLKSVVIPETVHTIGSEAFSGCGLKSIIIPRTVRSVRNDSFDDCSSLIKSAFPSHINNPFKNGAIVMYSDDATVENGYIWSEDKTALYFVPFDITGEFEIPNSVKSIGYNAFYGCSDMTKVTIPNSVTEIGESAFENCSGLTSIDIPNSVTSINRKSFSGCSGLTSIDIPNSVTNIGYWAFESCSSLTSIDIPNSVTEIGGSAFESCSSLTSIDIPNSVTWIGGSAFKNCSSLTKVTIPNSVTYIHDSAFESCSSLTSIDIPNSVTSIDEYAFRFCSGLESVIIPNSVTTIGEDAFYGCSGLRSVIIPNSVTTIKSNAFGGCSSLVKTAFPSGMENPFEGGIAVEYPAEGEYSFEDGCVWTADKSVLYFVPLDVEGEFNIPGSVTAIGSNAFAGCDSIASLNVESIEPADIESNSFPDYSIDVTVPTGALTVYLSSDWSKFTNLKDASGVAATAFTDDVFNYRLIGTNEAILMPGDYKSMTTVSIPERVVVDDRFVYVTAIANSFTDCTKITSLVLPKRLATISTEAFKGCTGLTSLNLPESLTTIGNNAFEGCTGLTALNLPASLTEMGAGAFKDCNRLASVGFPASLTEISDEAFSGCTALTALNFPESLNAIGDEAFNSCIALKEVTIEGDLESIGAFAFVYCRNLKTFNRKRIGTVGNGAFGECMKLDNITVDWAEIAYQTFYNCDGLKSLTLTNDVTAIGDEAFYACDGLASVSIPASVDSIGREAFYWCSKMESFRIEDGSTALEIGGSALQNAPVKDMYIGRDYTYQGKGSISAGITSLTFGNEVTSIPDNAFNGASGLAAISFGTSIETIGANAFKGCAFTELVMPPHVKTVGDNAFSGNNIKNIAIGSEITEIGEKAFDGANELAGVSITALTPPMANNNTFSYYDCPLYVSPSKNNEVKDAYYNFTRCWYRFTGYDLIPIEKLEVEGKATVALNPGETHKFDVAITPANASLPYIFWRSTNPEFATVDNDGNVTLTGNGGESAQADGEVVTECRIIAETLYADGPVAEFTVQDYASAIDDIVVDTPVAPERPNDIYNLQGICLKRNASQEDVDALAPGLYIIGGKKVLVK